MTARAEAPHPPTPDALADAAAELRVLAGRLTRRLRAAEPTGSGITLSQSSVLGRLVRNGPATTVALARAEMVRPQSMGATLAALEAAGLIARTPHPDDRRQALLSVTPQGEAHVRAVRREREGWLLDAIRSKLDGPEQAALIEAIALLDRIVGDEPPAI